MPRITVKTVQVLIKTTIQMFDIDDIQIHLKCNAKNDICNARPVVLVMI